MQSPQPTVVDSNSIKVYSADVTWTLPRKFVLEYTSKHLGETAAEEAFKIFNAPEEFLDDDEMRIVKQYRGHSLSVGDVVQVDGVDYLCSGVGWTVKSDMGTLV